MELSSSQFTSLTSSPCFIKDLKFLLFKQIVAECFCTVCNQSFDKIRSNNRLSSYLLDKLEYDIKLAIEGVKAG